MSSGKNLDGEEFDPALMELRRSLTLARETGAAESVVSSIERTLHLYDARQQYAEDKTSKESETCVRIKDETNTHNWDQVFQERKSTWRLHPIMMSGVLEGQFLKSFLSASKAKRVLDVGMFTGYSAVAMAEALPADGEVVTLEYDPYLKDLVQTLIQQSPHKHKINIVLGDALTSMSEMVKDGEKFDAIFMDGTKEEYQTYLKHCLDGLLAPEGTILIDNAFNFGTGYTEPDGVSARFGNNLIGNHDLHVCLVPIRDGIYLARRRVDVDKGVL